MVKKVIAVALTAVMFTTSAYAACDISVKNSQVTLNLSDFKGYNEVMIRVFREGFDGNDLLTAQKMTDVIAYQTQVKTDNKGKAEVSFYLDKSGNYTIEVGELDGVNTEKYTLSDYADISYSDNVIESINEAVKKKDSASVKTLIEENYITLNLNAKMYAELEDDKKEAIYSLVSNGNRIDNSTELEKQLNTAALLVSISSMSEAEAKIYIENNIANTVYADSGMYKVYSSCMSDDLKEAAIKDMQKAEYSSCEEALEKYTEIVLTITIGEALGGQTVKSALTACINELDIDLEKCEKLKNPMNVYQALCGGTYADIEDIEKAFEDAYDEQYDKENSKKGSSGGGGGGGGGGGVSAPTMIIRDPDTIKAENTAQNITVNSTPLPEINEIFNDLAGYEWAKEDILSLYNKGIVSGKGEGVFAPSDNVTREEFVKLLTLALNIYDENADCEFGDVAATSWYYTYVASAVNGGIVKGIDDSSFGTGRLITREDAAVMLNRAMGNAQAQTVDTSTITDLNEISDYAVDSVTAMYEKGILTGNADGTFKPKNNTTRAEAAVIISRMLKNI